MRMGSINDLKDMFDAGMQFMNHKFNVFGFDVSWWNVLVYLIFIYLLLRFVFKMFK